MRISQCAWCGKARRVVARDYGNPSGVAVMLHSERFAGLHMHAGCVFYFRESLTRLIGFDVTSVPFIATEFGGFTADETRNA